MGQKFKFLIGSGLSFEFLSRNRLKNSILGQESNLKFEALNQNIKNPYSYLFWPNISSFQLLRDLLPRRPTKNRSRMQPPKPSSHRIGRRDGLYHTRPPRDPLPRGHRQDETHRRAVGQFLSHEKGSHLYPFLIITI